ncbi:ATP-binding protein [Devosia sp. Root635]|uniref:ATP-binding protein n=1 Tax=Devosia sp. Root635 TaxID=1736575 RepID=UPI00138F86CE|nr:ATP-binding protein [Devosia sp. Root635]
MRRRRLVLILANVVWLLAVLGLAGWTLSNDARRATRMNGLAAEMSSIQDVDAAIANYAAQLARFFLLGRDQQADLRSARLAIERAFVTFAQTARTQVAIAIDADETQDALRDVENARRMLELYHAIDQATARAIVLDRDHQPAQAMTVYEGEVDFRLSTEFAALLDDARTGGQTRIDAAGRTAAVARQQALIAWSLAAASGAILLGLTALMLWRRPSPAADTLAQAYEARAEELRDSNRRLRETDARRGQFLADVSHELRTPLTILRGEADVALLPRAGPEEQRRSLERIQDQAEELGQLLDDLIAFARFEGEALPLHLAPVLLGDLLAAAVDDAEALAEPREVVLDLSMTARGVWVSAEARRLKQALIIGIDNAINHSPPGSTVKASLAATEAGAEIRISDQGSGISAEDEERVFDRFYRGSGSTGLGIGLAIAKGIVDQHSGTITLTNDDEGGATLTIVLPLHAGPLP